jgi:DNA-binding NtrC family response regulator
MITLGLYSEDRKLQPLLSPALGKEFAVIESLRASVLQEMAAAGECGLVLLDLDGSEYLLQQRVEVCRELVAAQIPVVLLAADHQRPAAQELVDEGAFGYCRKPPALRELKIMLQRAQESSSLRKRLQTAEAQLEAACGYAGMVGHSAPMQQVYDLVRRVANLNASVLITGESGTGKELIAQAIHSMGNRAARPFVAVSCGAIPETLIEAELFGHEKGAFTGTVGAREGYLEQAGDGTLFLDEIGELSMNTQVKLLRVLQQREFSRLGSSRTIPLRARVIFATHQNLEAMVAAGQFRQDLYYRIHVMTIPSPALRERAEDIAALAMHFLQQYSEMYEKPMREIEPAAMAMLSNYAWPGNVRELENVIQRAIILAPEQSIRPADLPENLQEHEDRELLSVDDFAPAGTFDRLLRDYKVKLAETAVRENDGNKTMAARSLCISRAYLHRLIRLSEHCTHELSAA